MNKQNDCHKRREAITAFALGELEHRAADELKKHIDTCETCRSLYHALVDEEETIRSAFQAIADRSETLQHNLVKQLDKHDLVSPQTYIRSRKTVKVILSAIMKSPITKIAAAAVIVIAVMIVIQQFGVPIDVTNVAWADVQEAFLAQTWVHLKYNNDTELWYDLKEGKRYYKDWDGRCVFVDRVLNIRQSYVPEWGEHISEDRPTTYEDGVIPPWEPQTAWEVIVEHWEQRAETGSKGHSEVERAIEQVDGTRLVRFDRYYNDAVGRRLLVKQIWADPETRLPVKVWERLSLSYREKQNREFITGEFDFPESGPASVYDLGVPGNVPIVKHYDRTADPFIMEVIKAGKNALDRFPPHYRLVRWANDRESEVDIYWRDGKKIHFERYFNLDYPEYHLELPANVQEVLEWIKSQVPVHIDISDGNRDYYRTGPLPRVFEDQDEPSVRVSRPESFFSSSKPHGDMWPYVNRDAVRPYANRDAIDARRFERIEDVPEELSKYIDLRIDRGDIRRDFYIDPEHDYLCVRWIWWKERSGKWEKKREYEYSGFTRLPQGQWYATKQVLITYPDPERGTSRGGANWNIDVKVLEENEYPQDTFNGEKLLEGVKKVETY